MPRYVLALSLAAFVLAGCSSMTEMLAGEEQPPDETTQEEVAPVEEGPEESVEDTSEAGADEGWDQAVQTNFYESCLSASRGATGYCQCTLGGLQERFSQDDFEAIEQEVTGSEALPPEFEEVIDACIEEHQDEIAGFEESTGGQWSAAAQSEFLFGCIESSAGTVEHCECALDGMQETYTESEFEELSLGLERGEATPPEFDAVVDVCLQQHG